MINIYDFLILYIYNFIATPSNPKGSPNVHIIKTADGQLVKSFEYRDYKLWYNISFNLK